MQLNENAKTGDLLAEISRLEDQISKLSSQLSSNHEAIELLKLTLAERDSRIHELEANLVITPKFLLQNTLNKLIHCRTQIKEGIDEKLINPVLVKTRQQIELIQCLINDSKGFIQKTKQVIEQNINTALEIANQGPNQARLYFEKNIIEPILSLVHQFLEVSNRHLKATQTFIGQNILSPSKSLYENGVEVMLALPAQSQILFQVWVQDPSFRTLNKLIDFGHRMTDVSVIELKNMWVRIRKLMALMAATISDYVKNSQFWDGKRHVGATA